MPINSRKRVVIQLEHKYNLRGYFVITTEVYNPHWDEWVLDENSKAYIKFEELAQVVRLRLTPEG
jgi:hypothetical protein